MKVESKVSEACTQASLSVSVVGRRYIQKCICGFPVCGTDQIFVSHDGARMIDDQNAYELKNFLLEMQGENYYLTHIAKSYSMVVLGGTHREILVRVRREPTEEEKNIAKKMGILT